MLQVSGLYSRACRTFFFPFFCCCCKWICLLSWKHFRVNSAFVTLDNRIEPADSSKR